MVAPVNILFASDFHLGAYDTLFPEADRPDDFVFRVLRQIVAYADTHGIRSVVVPGDLFDTPNPSDESQIDLIRFFLGCPHIVWYVSTGNHDYSHEGVLSITLLKFMTEQLAVLPNVKYFTERTHIDIEGVPFTFLPWTHTEVEVTQPHFVVAHLDVAGAVRHNGHPIKKGFVPPPRHFWYIGHIHKAQTVGANIWYTGNVLQKNFGEDGEKSFTHGLFVKGPDGRWRVKNKRIPIALPFQLHTVRVENHDDLVGIAFESSTAQTQHRYKIFLHRSVVLPPTWMTRNPQVVKVEPFSDATQLQYDTATVAPAVSAEIDLRKDLDEFMAARQVPEPVRVRAHAIMQDTMLTLRGNGSAHI